MLKKLDYDYYFKDSIKEDVVNKNEFLSATGLITPTQNIEVFNVAPEQSNEGIGFGNHYNTINEILCNIYDIFVPDYMFSFDVRDEIEKVIPRSEDNFIFIRYALVNKKPYVVIFIPKYITSYQLDEIKKMHDIYKEYNINADAMISSFNPITREESGSSVLFENLDDNLQDAINYLENNNRIVEYELPFTKEKIINYNYIK